MNCLTLLTYIRLTSNHLAYLKASTCFTMTYLTLLTFLRGSPTYLNSPLSTCFTFTPLTFYKTCICHTNLFKLSIMCLLYIYPFTSFYKTCICITHLFHSQQPTPISQTAYSTPSASPQFKTHFYHKN